MRYIITLFLITVFSVSWSQQLDKRTFKNLFQDAEYYFLFENYKKALDIYQEIYDSDAYHAQHNANLNYRIGYCYLKDPVNNYKAFEYLEKAINGLTTDYKEGSASEYKAPVETYYLLGDAYKNIFEFDKAIFAYQQYETYLDVTEIEELNRTQRAIQSCKNAKELLLLSEHNFVEATNLGPVVNTAFPEYYPVVSEDTSILVFTSRRNYDIYKQNRKDDIDIESNKNEVIVDDAFYDEDIYYSKKIKGQWSTPTKISAQLKTDFESHVVSISHDGKTLLLAKDEVGLGNVFYSNLYISELVNGRWTKAEEIEGINTKGWESQACLSPDKKTLYFSSEREGGLGGMDIYMSKKNKEGTWSQPVNLGPTINTEFNEEFPQILKDGKTLFFASQGHFNMGGYDIFYSRKTEDDWSVPINMGFPINTMEDNKFYFPFGDGTTGFMSMISDEGMGVEDIFQINISTVLDFNKYYQPGSKSLADIQDETKGNHRLQDKLFWNYNSENSKDILLAAYNVEEGTTADDIIEASMKDTEKLLEKSRQLRKESDIAFLIAEEKNLMAKDKRKEASALIKEADTISDPQIKDLQILKAKQIQKESDLLAVMAYNLARKIDNSAIHFKDIANQNKQFTQKLQENRNKPVDELADQLNKNRMKLNRILGSYLNLEDQLVQEKNKLADKSRRMAFHQNKLDVVQEEIEIVKDTIQSKKDRLNKLITISKNSESDKEAQLFEEEKSELNAELKYLENHEVILVEKQYNALTNFEKLHNEVNILDKSVVVIEEVNNEVKTNTEPIAAIAEKATLARKNLEGISQMAESLNINKLIQPEDKQSILQEASITKNISTQNNNELADNTTNNTQKDNEPQNTNQHPIENNSQSENIQNIPIDTTVHENKKVTVDSVAQNQELTDVAKDSTEAEIETSTENENIADNNSENKSNIETSQDTEIVTTVDQSTNQQNEQGKNQGSTNQQTENSTTEPNQQIAGTPGFITLKGKIILQDNNTFDSSFRVTIYDESNNDEPASIKPDSETGEYSYYIKPGNYKIIIQGNGYDTKTEQLIIPTIIAKSNIVLITEMVPEEVASGEYYIAKAIFFDYDDYSLNREAKIELEKLVLLMKDNTDLYLEISGFTDSRGSVNYNKKLAKLRTKATINYLVSKGIKRERFVEKAIGESCFIANNTHADGRDNPSGRKLNRRVEIKVLNSTNAKIIQKPLIVPENLKYKAYTTIQLAFSPTELPKNNFSEYNHDILKEIKTYRTNNGFVYTAGQFNEKHEAVAILNQLVDMGLSAAKIITTDDIEEVREPYYNEIETTIDKEELRYADSDYTIQLKALRTPVNIDYFQLKGVKEYLGTDNIYRYIYKSFSTHDAASEALEKVKQAGYPDAFITKIETIKGKLPIFDNHEKYTIQVKASKKPIHSLGKIKEIEPYLGKDGTYRYSFGTYHSLKEARKELEKVKGMGFKDAFIVNKDRYNTL